MRWSRKNSQQLIAFTTTDQKRPRWRWRQTQGLKTELPNQFQKSSYLFFFSNIKRHTRSFKRKACNFWWPHKRRNPDSPSISDFICLAHKVLKMQWQRRDHDHQHQRICTTSRCPHKAHINPTLHQYGVMRPQNWTTHEAPPIRNLSMTSLCSGGFFKTTSTRGKSPHVSNNFLNNNSLWAFSGPNKTKEVWPKIHTKPKTKISPHSFADERDKIFLRTILKILVTAQTIKIRRAW